MDIELLYDSHKNRVNLTNTRETSIGRHAHQTRRAYINFICDLLSVCCCGIRAISNELNLTFHGLALQLSGHCDFISNIMWRHQKNEWDMGRVCEEHCFYRLVWTSFRVRNNIIYIYIRALVTNCLCAHLSLFWCLFPSALLNSGTNTKITLSWAHKQFTTHLSTYNIFYMYVYILRICVRLIGRSALSVIFYAMWVCAFSTYQRTHSFCEDCKHVCTLIFIKSEVWTISHCFGLVHIFLCAAYLAMLWYIFLDTMLILMVMI